MTSRVMFVGCVLALFLASFPAKGEEFRYVSISTGSDTSGDGSQLSPWRTIQHAIDQIHDATETRPYSVHVASGSYTGTATNVVTMKPYVDLLGGYEPASWSRDIASNTTVIDGQNSRRCVCAASDSKLDGFTLIRGQSGEGGGVFCRGSSPTLINCHITRNLASEGGAVYSPFSGVILTNCTLNLNKAFAGGAIYCEWSNPTINNCTISDNSGEWGGGIRATAHSQLRLNNCVIDSNSKAGINVDYSTYSILNNCIVNNNRDYGIYGDDHCTFIMDNCNITKNRICGIRGIDNIWVNLTNCSIRENYGGGIACDENAFINLDNCNICENQGCGVYNSYCDPWGSCDSSIHITNCTIAYNYDGLYYSITEADSYSTVTNCIFWNNNNEIIIVGESSDMVILSYNWIRENQSGIGDISQDPCFMDVNHGDFHLQETSPCIDQGIGPVLNSSVPAFDIDGEPRSGNTCDIGADEYSLRSTATSTLTPTITPTFDTPTPTETGTITPTPTITDTPTPSVTQTETQLPTFDINSDGHIDATDLIYCIQHVFERPEEVMEFSIYWQESLSTK